MQDFLFFHLKRKDKVRVTYYLVSTIFACIAAVIFFAGRKIYALLLIVAAILMFVLFGTRAKQIAKKKVQHMRIKDVCEITFTDEDIVTKCENKTRRYQWESIKEVCEVPKYFYFYFSSCAALIVIKDELQNVEKEGLLKLIEDKKLTLIRYKKV